MLQWNKYVPKQIVMKAQRGLLYGMQALYNEAQTVTPFDTGELVLGARLSSDGEGTDTFSAVVSYGNDAVSQAYAVVQHENRQYRHRPPEQAEYLLTATLRIAPTLPSFIAWQVGSIQQRTKKSRRKK
jgi:hypothetical protein